MIFQNRYVILESRIARSGASLRASKMTSFWMLEGSKKIWLPLSIYYAVTLDAGGC